MINKDDFELLCLEKAQLLVKRGVIALTPEMDLFQLTDLLIKLEQEKTFKNDLSDKLINFEDEIIAIEDVGDMDTIDISVSGDNLFYCNNILTKNSFGLPATADFMVALIATEQLDNLNQMMVKQLKNRYSDMSRHRRFIIGVDRAKMRLYDVEDSAQTLLSSEGNSGGSNNKGPATDQQKPQFGHNAGIKRFRPGVVGSV